MQAQAIIFSRLADKAPPHLWFGVSAVFHYLGPAFAVLLFPSVGVLGVAWLRIATAACSFRRSPGRGEPSAGRRADAPAARRVRRLPRLMNCAFYLALERLPLSLVAAIEFVGTIVLALFGLRSGRNLLALALAVVGAFCLIDVSWSSDPSACLGAAQRRDVRRLRRARPSAGRAGVPPTASPISARRWRSPCCSCCRSALARPWPPFPRRCCWVPRSGSASARRSSPISATSWPCRGCRARASR